MFTSVVRRSASLAIVALVVAASLTTACTKKQPTPSPAPATDTATDVETPDYDAAYATAAEGYSVPSGIAAVWVPGQEDWETTSGGLSTDDHVPIRSITKSFTTTLALQLVRDGKLSLDDPISRYVDGVPNGDEITIEQLAGMTSGLQDYSQNPKFLKLLVKDLGHQWTTDELLEYGLSQEPAFAPGADFLYSNTNTLLVGKVVEKITGKPLATLYEEEFFGPLALMQTSYPDNAEIPEPFPTPYQLDNETGEFEELPTLNLSALGASGGIVSTLDDLHIWAEALGAGELIGPELQQVREETVRPTTKPKYDAYGLGMGQLNGWWGHTGEGLGYQVAMFRRPADGAVIVVLLNSSQTENAATEIFQALEGAVPDPA